MFDFARGQRFRCVERTAAAMRITCECGFTVSGVLSGDGCSRNNLAASGKPRRCCVPYSFSR